MIIILILSLIPLSGLSQTTPTETRSAKELFNWGGVYYHAFGVPMDRIRGCQLFKESAALGYPEAFRAVGDCYRVGVFGEPDMEQSIAWYEQSYQNGNIAALGLIIPTYLFGMHDLEKSYAYAQEMISKTSNKPSVIDRNGIAFFTLYVAEKQNQQTKINYLKKASEAQLPHAMAQMAYFYKTGHCLPKNQPKPNEYRSLIKLMYLVRNTQYTNNPERHTLAYLEKQLKVLKSDGISQESIDLYEELLQDLKHHNFHTENCP